MPCGGHFVCLVCQLVLLSLVRRYCCASSPNELLASTRTVPDLLLFIVIPRFRRTLDELCCRQTLCCCFLLLSVLCCCWSHVDFCFRLLPSLDRIRRHDDLTFQKQYNVLCFLILYKIWWLDLVNQLRDNITILFFFNLNYQDHA